MMFNIGYDLDGVIAQEGRGLDICFALSPRLGVYVRDTLIKPLYKVVTIGHIITGRPNSDRVTTEQWLHRHAVPYSMLHMSPVFSRIAAITFKADMALKLGLTHYVESDAEQAELIKRLCPNLDVMVPAAALTKGYIQSIPES